MTKSFLIYQECLTRKGSDRLLLVGLVDAPTIIEAVEHHLMQRRPNSQLERERLKRKIKAFSATPQQSTLVTESMLEKNLAKLGIWR